MTFRKLAWLGIVPMAAILFFSCQKNDLNPSLTSEAKGGNGGGSSEPNFQVGITVSPGTTVCPDASFSFTVVVTNKGGQIPGDNGQKRIDVVFGEDVVDGVDGTTGTFNLTAPLEPGDYDYHIVYYQNNQKQFEGVKTITVTSDCSGSGGGGCGQFGLVGLTTRTDLIDIDQNLSCTRFQQTFTLTPCNYSGYFKLQGGLTANASLIGCDVENSQTSPGYVIQKGGGTKNTILNWISGQAGACGNTPGELNGTPLEFTVDFTKTPKWVLDPNDGNFYDFLTGAWSVKDADGNLLDSYTARLRVMKIN